MTEQEIDKYIAETMPFLVENVDNMNEDLSSAIYHIRRYLRNKK